MSVETNVQFETIKSFEEQIVWATTLSADEQTTAFQYLDNWWQSTPQPDRLSICKIPDVLASQKTLSPADFVNITLLRKWKALNELRAQHEEARKIADFAYLRRLALDGSRVG